MSKTLKIFIPMAGLGTRMRPHTWSKPKPLISVAGKTTLEHLLDMFKTVPDPNNVEYIFIVGPYLGESQIPKFIEEKYPHMKAHYVVQTEMKGQSHALWLAREHLKDRVIIIWSDTLLETDFSFLANESSDGVAWVEPVPDPRRFGVAVEGADGWITQLIEKQSDPKKNLALVGCYYFKSGEALLEAIERQMAQGDILNGEYFLVDALNIMLKNGTRLRTSKDGVWLDTGTPESLLKTNRYLLKHGRAVSPSSVDNSVNIIHPVFIDATARILNSTIGPYTSIGPNCIIRSSHIEDSVIDESTEIYHSALIRSLIGRNCIVEGLPNQKQTIALNIGDNSEVRFEE